jgi:hypothetical protein
VNVLCGEAQGAIVRMAKVILDARVKAEEAEREAQEKMDAESSKNIA